MARPCGGPLTRASKPPGGCPVAERVLVSEVGPRDGLQMVKGRMATADKLAWIDALAAAGLREIEVGTFAPPRVLPMMADIETVVAHARRIEGLCVAALAPNLRGGELAMAAGAHKVTVPVSVSRTHSQANVNKPPEAVVAEVAALVAMRDARGGKRVAIEGGLSTAFGCSVEGPVAEDAVVRLAEMLAEAGADAIGLADSAGMADPRQVRRLIRRVRAAVAERLDGIHLHNTNGLGLANAYAAFEEGVRTFDASLGGLGGCPFAPGASGNIVTEDLVHMFARMGVDTGIDLAALLAARRVLARGLPDEPLYGHVPRLPQEAHPA